MKLLIILFCLVLLFRNPKEAFLGKTFKKIGRGIKNVSKSVTKSVTRNVFAPIARKVFAPIVRKVYKPIVNYFLIKQRQLQERLKREEEERLQRKKCSEKYNEVKNLDSLISKWQKNLDDLLKKKYDTNFGIEVYNFHSNELWKLNDIINDNTSLNNDINDLLTKIEILQNDSKIKIDNLNTLNTDLKECEMNKELTENDFEVLK